MLQFSKKKTSQILFDLPIIINKNKTVKKKFSQKYFLLSSWPRFSPQSCISIRKIYGKEVFRSLKIKKFNLIWFDFRIAFQSYIDYKKINFINRHLTYYQQSSSSASSKYARFSKNWWKRRKEAHNFVKYLSKKNDRNVKSNLDELITNTFNFILNNYD